MKQTARYDCTVADGLEDIRVAGPDGCYGPQHGSVGECIRHGKRAVEEGRPVDLWMAKVERRARKVEIEVGMALTDIPALTDQARRLRALLQECVEKDVLPRPLEDLIIAELNGDV